MASAFLISTVFAVLTLTGLSVQPLLAGRLNAIDLDEDGIMAAFLGGVGVVLFILLFVSTTLSL